MSETKEQSKGGDQILYFLIATFVILLAERKLGELKPVLFQWINNHLWTIAGLGSLLVVGIATFTYAALRVLKERRKIAKYIASVTSEKPGSVYAGKTDKGEKIFIPIEARRMHTQVIGTTNAGKSESVIIPWAVGDMKDNRGFVIVDGKADQTFINKIYAYAKQLKRTDEFKVFSLQDPNRSLTFNPLLGGSPEEVAERVFNSFEFDNSYYASVQYEIFSKILRIFDNAKVPPTFLRIYQAIKNPEALHNMAANGKDETLEEWASGFKTQSPSDREEKTSGLLAALSHFSFGSHAKLFNTDDPDIDLEKALRGSELIYFQLPVLKAAFLGKATGKLVLQCLQSAVANRHQEGEKEHPFFSIFLDDFTEYLYPGFVSLLNKSRSANVGVVFAHQALGDIKALGEDVAGSILTCSNLKIVMRGNDPESAEYFAKVIGTKEGEKLTERSDYGYFGQNKTGQGSVREVEEFLVHPNIIKRNMGIGEALVFIPHQYGTRGLKLMFHMLPSLPKVEMPKPQAKSVLNLVVNPQKDADEQSKTKVVFDSQQTPNKKETA